MAWVLGTFMGMAWTLGSWDSATVTPSACPLHPPSLPSFPRDSWNQHCYGHDLSEWLRGCHMNAKPNKKIISWVSFPGMEILFSFSVLSSVDIIKDDIYKQCKQPLMSGFLHFSSAWRCPLFNHSLHIFKALIRGDEITWGGAGR